MIKIVGFQAGGDDYIVKPFDMEVLGARVEAHLRREQRRTTSVTVRFFGELAVDYTGRTVSIRGEAVKLSKREFDIVELLSMHQGQVFDQERIYEIVWGMDGDGFSGTVIEHIRKVRAKLSAKTLHNYIETVWGWGIDGMAEKPQFAKGLSFVYGELFSCGIFTDLGNHEGLREPPGNPFAPSGVEIVYDESGKGTIVSREIPTEEAWNAARGVESLQYILTVVYFWRGVFCFRARYSIG